MDSDWYGIFGVELLRPRTLRMNIYFLTANGCFSLFACTWPL
jgi:hypothetical protein